MVVAYHWKLNADVIFTEDAPDAMREHEFPVAAQTGGDLVRVRERWPNELCASAAQGEWARACAAESGGDLRQASRHFQWAAAYVERFDSPEAVSFSADCYDRAAQCELSMRLPILAASLLRQVVTLRTRTGAPLDRHVALLSRAVADDGAMLRNLEKLLDARGTTSSRAATAVDYCLLRPTPKRTRIARGIIEGLSREDPQRVLLGARCAAAEGDLSAAIAAIDSMGSVPADASGWRDEWKAISAGDGFHVARAVFRRPDDEAPVSLAGCVNRGFTLLANALYFEALAWFMSALHRSRRDPFALFGHGLTSWRMEAFGVAKRSLERAIEALRVYPREYRWLSFARDDPGGEPRSYQMNPAYPIFNMNECLARVTRCESFVRHAILP